MKIAIVFHKDPFKPANGMDLVRLRAISGGLIRQGLDVDVVSPMNKEGTLNGFIPVRPVSVLNQKGRYDVVKTSYHYSIKLVGAYDGPVLSRIVRVVDHILPERDEPFRGELLECQKLIRERATALVLNNTENETRWRALYGQKPPVVLIPNGCPVEIPASRENPFDPEEPAILFLGSLAAPRMIDMINKAAERLQGKVKFHLVGLNKCGLYGGGDTCFPNRLIVDHGEMPENEVWNYIQHADIGLALATGPHAFDNDVSKIFNYLRGGLPVLTEDPILTNKLVKQTGLGKIFMYGNVDDLISNALELLDNPMKQKKKEAVMKFMIEHHSWEKRVKDYALFLRSFI